MILVFNFVIKLIFNNLTVSSVIIICFINILIFTLTCSVLSVYFNYYYIMFFLILIFSVDAIFFYIYIYEKFTC